MKIKNLSVHRALLLVGLLLLVVLTCVIASAQHYTTKVGVLLYFGGAMTCALVMFLLGVVYRPHRSAQGLYQLRSMEFLALRFYSGLPIDYLQAYRSNLKETEIILQAAIRHAGGHFYSVDAPGSHPHVIQAMAEMGRAGQLNTETQGFITSHGRFVDRVEALRIATAANQLLRNHADARELCSEDLWDSPKPGLDLVNVKRANDEPFFLLLARDPQAPELIQQWARDRQKIEPSTAKIQDALAAALLMVDWKSRNTHVGLTREAYLNALSTYTQSPLAQLQEDLEGLVLRARAMGKVVTVEQRSPPGVNRMGCYETAIDIRDDMPTWRAQLAAQDAPPTDP